jgi:predicted nucleic acid-binding protein
MNPTKQRVARQAAKPRVAELIKPHKVGRLVNLIRKLAGDVGALLPVESSSNPPDDLPLAMSEADKADYPVTGDKSGLLALDRPKVRGLFPRAILLHYLHELSGGQRVFCQ